MNKQNKTEEISPILFSSFKDEVVSPIKKAIYEHNYKELEAIMSSLQVSQSIPLQTDLFYAVFEEPYFFNYNSSDVFNTQIEHYGHNYYQELEKNIIGTFIKHFIFPFQVCLLTLPTKQFIEYVDTEMVNNILQPFDFKYIKKNINKEKDSDIDYYMTNACLNVVNIAGLHKCVNFTLFTQKLLIDLFHKEKFDCLDALKNKYHIDLSSFKDVSFYVNYETEHSTGCFFLTHNLNNFKPVYDILIKYTENKANYLRTNKIVLPNEKEVNDFYSTCIDLVKSSDRLPEEYCDIISNGVANYKFHCLNNELVKSKGYSLKEKITHKKI